MSSLIFPEKLQIANPKERGIVDEVEVSGSRKVNTVSELYSIADSILSPSGDNTDNDALGQTWYVANEGLHYYLLNWSNRNNSSGWALLSSIVPDDVGSWSHVIKNESEQYDYGVLSSFYSYKVIYTPAYLPIFTVGNSYIDLNHYLSPTSQNQYYSMNLADEYYGGGGASLYYGDISSGTIESHGFRVSVDNVKAFGLPLTLEYQAEEDDQAVRLDQLNEVHVTLLSEVAQAIAASKSVYSPAQYFVSSLETLPAPAYTDNANTYAYYGTLENLGFASSSVIYPWELYVLRRNGTDANESVPLWARILRWDDNTSSWTISWQSKNSVNVSDFASEQGTLIGPYELEPVNGTSIPSDENILIVFVGDPDEDVKTAYVFSAAVTNQFGGARAAVPDWTSKTMTYQAGYCPCFQFTYTIDSTTVPLDSLISTDSELTDKIAAETERAMTAEAELAAKITAAAEGVSTTLEERIAALELQLSKTTLYSATNPALSLTDNGCVWVVTHSLNTKDVVVQVTLVDTNMVVYPDVEITDSNTVTVYIDLDAAVAAGVYKVVVLTAL